MQPPFSTFLTVVARQCRSRGDWWFYASSQSQKHVFIIDAEGKLSPAVEEEEDLGPFGGGRWWAAMLLGA
jgi:hypothetical protein